MKRKAICAAACLSLLLTGCVTKITYTVIPSDETTAEESVTETEEQATEKEASTFDDIFIQEIKADVESGDYDGAIELAREHRDELKSLTVNSWMSAGNGVPNGETIYYTSPDGGYEGTNPRTIQLVNGLFNGVLPAAKDHQITFVDGKIQCYYDEAAGYYVFEENGDSKWGNKNEDMVNAVYGASGFGDRPY